ncbi:MAG: xanthine dehydrogenase family protein molybdopterin-binding subunit, partial [Pseudolabrys sp.]|nr:xanthine dehydrogenase family protein molybdopterin-binding subunit [Pseudolabrys sp.]
VIEKAKGIAAHALQVDIGEIKFVDGVFSAAKSNRTLTWKEIAADSQLPAKIPANMEPGLAATSVHKTPVNNYPNGCHICEVEIDAETGETQVVRYSVVDDVGTVLNPLLLHGQIHGGVAQGVGQILLEDIQFDQSGQLVTASFMDYAMPRAHHLSDIEMESNPVPTKTNPLGTKGAGEAGCVGALPAVTNAIVNALSEFGVTHVDMPATPERVWRLMQSR